MAWTFSLQFQYIIQKRSTESRQTDQLEVVVLIKKIHKKTLSSHKGGLQSKSRGLTLQTQTLKFIFSTHFALHFLWHWRWELFWQSRAYNIGDYFLYSNNLYISFKGDTIERIKRVLLIESYKTKTEHMMTKEGIIVAKGQYAQNWIPLWQKLD